MRPVDGAVLAVLMVLLTAAQSLSPIRTTVPPTRGPTREPTREPTMEPTTEMPIALTREPTMEPTTEMPIAPTREPTMEPTTEMLIAPTRETTTELPIAPTRVCAMVTCSENCGYIDRYDGCLTCDCHPTCSDWSCGPYERCVMQDVFECDYPGRCFPEPTCMQYGTTTQTTTETTTEPTIGPPPPPVCPDESECWGSCSLDYTNLVDGCPTWVYVDPTCEFLKNCGPDEVCGSPEENPYDIICVSKYGTTTETTTIPPPRRTIETTTETTPVPPPTCPIIWCDDPNCYLQNGQDGCPECICTVRDAICLLVSCGPDETCVPNDDNVHYTCVSIYGTTTETTTIPLPRTTTETTIGTPPPPVCPDESECWGSCSLDYTNLVDGCPTWVWVDPTCEFIKNCSPDEVCGSTDENPYDIICVSKYGTTTETTTETTTWTPTPPGCTYRPCAELGYCGLDYTHLTDGCPTCICWDSTPSSTTTTQCPIADCFLIDCRTVSGSDGCLTCDCSTYNCDNVTCGPDQECAMQNVVDCYYPWCPPEPTCVPLIYETTTGTTATICPTISCGGPHCSLDYSSGECPTCFCDGGDPICLFVTCPPGEQCVPNDECPEGKCYSCVSIYETTTPRCPAVDCVMIGCRAVPGPDRCLTCDCSTDMCYDWPCGPDEICVLKAVVECQDPDWCYREPTCVPLYETTTGTTTGTTPFCPFDVTCGPYCGVKKGSDGCLACDCQPEDACQFGNYCNEYEECVPELDYCNKDTCFYTPTCIPISTTPTTTPSVTPTVWCPTVTCYQGCHTATDFNGCTYCDCPPSCENVTCDPGYVCELQEVQCFTTPCYPQPTCVAVQETTTPCPMFKCDPDCVPGTGPDGCPTCECPPSCQTVRCSADHECQLVNVTCFRYPCFPQPQCVPIKKPCTGTPNRRRCSGRSRNRWTYNSVTNTCEKFKYYGCTPSLNTFLSPKACRNKCQGSSQIVCPAVVCEKNCSTFTRKNKCPKCICSNPCKGFKCREGYECKLKEANCEDKDPKPFCARKGTV